MAEADSTCLPMSERAPNEDKAAMDISPPEERVDGGSRAWLTLLGAWMILFATWGYGNAFGVFQNYYQDRKLASPSNISWIGSVQNFLTVAMGMPAGRLIQKGWFHQVVIFGSALYIFSAFMLSLASPTKYYQIFLAQGLGMGAGSGLLYQPLLTVQAHHWKVHRSLAMGVVMTGASVGAIVFSIMLNQLLSNTTLGFAWSVRSSAFIILGMLVTANCIISPGTFHPPSPNNQIGVRSVLSHAPYTIAVLGIGFCLAGVYFPYFYLQVTALLHGVDSSLAFYIIAIMNGVSIFGRIVCGTLADRLGVFRIIVPACFISGALTLVMLDVRSPASAVVLAVLFGFSSGGFFALLGPVVVALTRDPAEFGLKMALTFGITSLGALAGTPIAGALIHGNEWWRPALFSAIMFFIGTAFIAIAPVMVSRARNGV